MTEIPNSPITTPARSTTVYWSLHRTLGGLARAFFRDLEVVGREQVPEQGGGIFVAWHPNGLIDPLLILYGSPRRVVFGARHGLFRMPLFGRVIRALGTVPLYRPQDAGSTATKEARHDANRRSLDALAASTNEDFVALFPEGATHDQSQPLEVRHGAARLWLRALAAGQSPSLIPVGLHYDKKHALRSRALVEFHPPLLIPGIDAQRADPDDGDQIRLVSGAIEGALKASVHATESWQLNLIMHRARKLVRAERAARAGVVLARPTMHERLVAFARLWHGYNVRRTSHPRLTARLLRRIGRYDRLLRLLRLEDDELDSGARSVLVRRIGAVMAEAFLVFVLMPPVVIVGYLVNLPVALLLKAIAKALSKTRKEQAGLKVMLAVVAFPSVWLGLAVLVALRPPRFWGIEAWIPDNAILAGFVAFLLAALSGAAALRYHRIAADLGRALRTLMLHLRHGSAIRSLLRMRRDLCLTLESLAEGLELPGELLADGRVAPIAVDRPGIEGTER